MAGNGGNIPKFGEWKTSDGASPYTMYFENARKRRTSSGIVPPPEAPPARMNTAPTIRGTPPRADDAKPVKSNNRANRSQSQGKAGNGSSVPPWGQWNESNIGGGAQQYTLVFDQLRDERSAPPTPSMEQLQLQRPTPNPSTRHELYDHVHKAKCCGLF